MRRYDGEKYKEQFHGDGVAHFQGGHVYKGVFSEGFMHGRGLYAWADGVTYEGEFVANVPMGYGKYTWLDGSSYEGEVYNAIRHGIGTYKCANSSVVYRGQWHHGKRHGKGLIYYNQDATSWYEGDWVNNNREGWGLRCYSSGNVYEGEWKNNVRHGEGKMTWKKIGQQYSGTWQNGVQDGRGTHTWFLKRVPGSQYPQRNEYRGEVVLGQRHGQGSFHYASGALYQGEWKNNKKHGQGKFIFKNGRIFEGEFVDDRMAEFPSFCLDGSKTPNLSEIRTHTPCGENGGLPQRLSGPGNGSSMLGPDLALDIGSLLANVPENQRDVEHKQVEFVVLRHVAELTSVYSFYSRLGHAHSPDNTYLLSRLQFWRLLKDCNVHHHGTTLAQVDRFTTEEAPPEEIHSPFTSLLLQRFLSSVVAVAYHTYREDIESPKNILAACFSKLMKDNILPNAKNVKGFLFSNPVRALVAVNYTERCWEIYQAFNAVKPDRLADRNMTCHHLVWMFKDLGLFDTKLTTRRLLDIITAENLDPSNLSYCNLDLEITFLEFMEVLLGCAEVRCEQAVQTSQPSPVREADRVSPADESRESPPPSLSSPHPAQSIRKSKDILQSSSSEDVETQLNPKSAVNLKSHTAAMGSDSVTQLSDPGTNMEVSLGRESIAAVGQLPALEAILTSSPSSLPSTGKAHPQLTEEDRVEAQETELDQWIQKTHQFFSKVFFPAWDHSQLVSREVEESRRCQEAQTRIALAKAQERARLREREAAEEDRQREEEEEEEAAAEEDRQDEEVNSSSPASQTPVASNTSVAITSSAAKLSTGTGLKKKKHVSRASVN
ncbi:radial spoke head 10 homolog B [Polymixia lowei]